MPLHRTILREHLRSISFVEGLQANAQTMRVDTGGTELLFHLSSSIPEFWRRRFRSSRREKNAIFEGGDSQVAVTVVAESMDALAFVLLHEATHAVDVALGLSVVGDAVETPFARGVWETAIAPAAGYRGEALDSTPWRSGKPLAIEKARALYEDLARTPFASVYSSLANVEDLAELVAWWQMTEIHGNPTASKFAMKAR